MMRNRGTRDVLAKAVVRYAERAEVERARPYDGWGETPEQAANWWMAQAQKAQELLDKMMTPARPLPT